MFCPKCRSLMFPDGDNIVCKKCEYKMSKSEVDSQKVVEKALDKEMLVIEGDLDLLPKTRVECPNCENNEAYWVMRQTRAADEPTTRIYRCTKCGHSWREY